ncbi:unnamed protein product [Prorocentrum cordatum]|uniref:Uncharacterized protein n=1 Tax=Prorocentrum cordatum TaxID=2364126 RepID=A0ABN9Q8T3_9DINO|nr:unnamed protein product [Polarella glacialis]
MGLVALQNTKETSWCMTRDVVRVAYAAKPSLEFFFSPVEDDCEYKAQAFEKALRQELSKLIFDPQKDVSRIQITQTQQGLDIFADVTGPASVVEEIRERINGNLMVGKFQGRLVDSHPTVMVKKSLLMPYIGVRGKGGGLNFAVDMLQFRDGFIGTGAEQDPIPQRMLFGIFDARHMAHSDFWRMVLPKFMQNKDVGFTYEPNRDIAMVQVFDAGPRVMLDQLARKIDKGPTVGQQFASPPLRCESRRDWPGFTCSGGGATAPRGYKSRACEASAARGNSSKPSFAAAATVAMQVTAQVAGQRAELALMPKIPISLEAAKAKDSDILAKLGRVKQAAASQKQQGKVGQQRLEWVEQYRRLSSEARRLEDDLQEAAGHFGLAAEAAAGRQAAEADAADAWFQVGGARQLLLQVRQRDQERLAKAPDQALELQAVLASISGALGGCASGLASEAARLEQECGSLRAPIRRELTSDGVWSVEQRHSEENRCDLSDEEDTLLDRIGDGPEAFQEELERLSEQVRRELGQLDEELAELRRRRSGWDEEANFRFACVRQQFQGRGRDLLVGRLLLEFPHLSREQLQAHEAHCDALKFASDNAPPCTGSGGATDWDCCGGTRRLWRRGSATRRRWPPVGRRRRSTAGSSDSCTPSCRRAPREGRNSGDEEQRRQQGLEHERELAQRRRAEQLRRACRAHSEQRREADEHRAEEAAEREAREARERAARLERNAARVKMRAAMDEMKQREVAQQRAAAEQEREEREHRLQRALERLKPEVSRNPERLLQVPEHSKAAAYAGPVACATAGRGPHAGFDEGRLMADARYKLSAALQSAGLYGTRAGQEALARAAGPRAPVPHEVSSVFAGPSAGYPR